MSLSTRLADLITAIGADIKSIRTQLTADRLKLGPDVSAYRLAANVLATDDAFFIGNSTEPSNPGGGAVLFSVSGKLKMKTAAGEVIDLGAYGTEVLDGGAVSNNVAETLVDGGGP